MTGPTRPLSDVFSQFRGCAELLFHKLLIRRLLTPYSGRDPCNAYLADRVLHGVSV